MSTSINHKASIAKGKLVLNEPGWEKWMDRAVLFLIALSLLFSSSSWLFNVLKEGTGGNDLHFSALFFVLAAAFVSLLGYKTHHLFDLKRLEGISQTKNRALTKKIVKEIGWQINRDNTNYMVASSGASAFSWGEQITILYDEKDVLINVFANGQFGIKSSFSFGNKSLHLDNFQMLFLEYVQNQSS